MKKVLVWDGDGTLWDGTIIEGEVQLPIGRLELCQELFDRGVVQAVASYNVMSDVEAVLHKFGLTNFFLVNQAELGGASKADMISNIKDELNLSKYSDIVFVDDNTHNIAEVEALLPDVITAYPDDINTVVECYFTKDDYTVEDRNRVRMYRSEIARRTSGEAFKGDKIDFLQSLALKATISRPTDEQMPRVVQLVERANRLAAKNPGMLFDAQTLSINQQHLRVLTAEDKYGNYGLSGVVYVMNVDGMAYIDLLVISCRLQGKGLGSTFLGAILNDNIGQWVQVIYTETEYNAGIKSLLEWYKFTIIEAGNVVIATKKVEEPVELPKWIEVTNGN